MARRTMRSTNKAARRVPAHKTRRAPHDASLPKALRDFMMTGWRPAARRMPPAIGGAARFAARRQALSAAFRGETLIIPTGHEKMRVNDTRFRFRPGSDFYYLSGNQEPDCVLVLVPKARRGHRHVLYVEPNPGRQDETFFTDRDKGELWVGPRLGVEQSRHRYGVDACLPLGELPVLLEALKRSTRSPYRLRRAVDPAIDDALQGVKSQRPRDGAFAAALAEMRLLKDAEEVKAIERAAAATRRGYEDIIRVLPTAKSEREVEGAFFARARADGNDVGYNTIAAAGAHGCILHWTRNDGPLRKGDLLLVDAGVESEHLYTADITRTLPISGTFSRTQRAVYDLVLAAQTAAIGAVKEGNDFLEPYRAAMKVLAGGLEKLGLLPCTADEALREERQLHKRYTLHSVSHMLGLDVHDCAHARPQSYRDGKLKAGMVLTVEPGLYFQEDDTTVPRRYRGIGVRIEDDVLVTKRGCRVLTDVPRKATDVERWMRDIWRGRA